MFMFIQSKLLLKSKVKHAFCFKHTSVYDLDVIFGIGKRKIISLNQCHSNICIPSTPLTNKNADGIISDKSNEFLTVKTADCIPIIIFSPTTKKYGLLHAGWKGLFNNIIYNATKGIEIDKNTIAAIGPCISKENYEVQDSFKGMFLKKHQNAETFFYPYKKSSYLFDIRAFCYSELKKHGIKKIDIIPINTYDNENFFSYRKAKHQNTLLNETERQITVLLT